MLFINLLLCPMHCHHAGHPDRCPPAHHSSPRNLQDWTLWAFNQTIISFNYLSLDTAHLYYLLVNASQSYLRCFSLSKKPPGIESIDKALDLI
ncbi:hypothetical protein EDD22DRAFT_932472 [Suillus occidentalis]|nr:hypothetical protein EDD22DRAFT_932472 [Suillus occidentalis]